MRGTTTRTALWVATGLAVLFAAYCYAAAGPNGWRDIAEPGMAHHSDFAAFRGSASALWNGGDPYRGSPANLNPPAWLPLFTIATLFDPTVAYRQWIVVAAAALLVTLIAAASVVRASAAVVTVGIVALMLSNGLQGTLVQGQVYTFLAAGLLAAWMLERRGNTLAAAITLGIVAALKVSLMPLLAWPLLHRRWRDGAAGGGGFVATFAFGLIFGGPAVTAGWVRAVTDHGQDGNPDDMGLRALTHRLFSPNAFTGHLVSLPGMDVVILPIVAVLLLATLWAARGTDLGLWTVTAACLLAAPIAWQGYLVLLAPAALLLLAEHRTRPVGALLVAAALVPPGWAALWPDKTTLAATLAMTWPCLVLVGSWAALLRTSRSSTARASVADEPVPAPSVVGA